jgi:hypothetical protein
MKNSKEKLTDPVADFLAAKGKALSSDYRDQDGNAEACVLLARDVARLLVQQGKRPTILSIAGKLLPGSKINSEALIPIQYREAAKVSWGGHFVCACDGLIYDPMLGEPVAIDAYSQRAFGAETQIKTLIGEDKIDDFIREK